MGYPSINTLNSDSEFNVPKNGNSGTLGQYVRGTAVLIDDEWYVVIRDPNDSNVIWVMDKEFDIYVFEKEDIVKDSGCVSVNIKSYKE